MIGITMPSVALNHVMKHFYEKDSIMHQYKTLADEYQVDLCIFSFRQIRQNLKMVEALVYSCAQDSLVRKTVTVPRVNIVRNTSYVVSQELINKFNRLRNQNIHFINFPIYRQANKLQNYEYLNSFDHLKSHVPLTKRLSLEHLTAFIQEYGKVIIKPVYGSKGREITIIEKDQIYYQVCQTSSRKLAYTSTGFNSNQKTISVPHSQIKLFYNETFSRPESFLVQPWIRFKKFFGRPYDIRAVVQKNGKNKWQLTSSVARVANEKAQITNLYQGGEMVSLSELQLKQKYHREIRQFCLETAKTFEKLYPWTAEMGIDLAIDEKGKLWYIETNFCPEKTRWATIFKIPFEYAYYMYTR
jgi:glutathione synthase/RimK-type ligase-like ATP-grasp enzyme